MNGVGYQVLPIGRHAPGAARVHRARPPWRTIDGRGNATATEYDALGRHAATVDPPGNRTAYAYDRFGNLASATDSLGQVTTYAYDLRGRKTYEGGATYPVRSVYDVFGNYNSRGELILATNVVTGAEFAYRYDDIGNRLWSRELGTDCTYAANELNP